MHMLTKLTLTIEQDVVVEAKKYAKGKHRSVSKIVEEYLKTVSNSENIRNKELNLEASLTNSITGMFSEEYRGDSYKDILETALLDKYL